MNPAILEYFRTDQPIILYGASSSGLRTLFNLVNSHVDEIRISFFDSDTRKMGRTFYGRPILTRPQFENLPRDILILISSALAYEIAPILEQKEFTNYHFEPDLIYSRKRYYKFDDSFLNILSAVQHVQRIDSDELYTLYHSARAVKDIPGAFAEVGVYKGGSSYLLASLVESKDLFLFDTFTGLPASSATNPRSYDEPASGTLNDTNVKDVEALVRSSGIAPEQLHIREGIFPGTARGLEHQGFSLIHLDTDLYQSTLDAFEFFYPRMSPGARLISHDYNCIGCPGVKAAFDEYFGKLGLLHLVIEVAESQALVIKQ